jgi:hypothetical protein
MLERIRVMIARKRGPKKAMVRPAMLPVPGQGQDAIFAGSIQPALAS